MGRPPKDAKIRFWSKVDKSGNWTASGDRNGYGQFRNEESKMEKAHRFVYRTLIADIPDGLYVLHKCDNPKCCNPEHLWLGTHQDNADDKVRKGRQSRMCGELNPMFGKCGELNPMFGRAGFGGRKHSPESIEKIKESNRRTWATVRRNK